jgi:hypothetical protein
MTALKAAELATRPAAQERDALLDAAGRRVRRDKRELNAKAMKKEWQVRRGGNRRRDERN